VFASIMKYRIFCQRKCQIVVKKNLCSILLWHV
jgi:hypothetical protein